VNILSSGITSSLALASSRRPSPHGICGQQSDTGTGFLQVFQFFHQYYFTDVQYASLPVRAFEILQISVKTLHSLDGEEESLQVFSFHKQCLYLTLTK
jgi:hypothetical protein